MKIVSVATAWGSQHGGVNVFNYRLCCALASLGHEVISYVKRISPSDLLDAQKKRIILKAIDKPTENKWTLDDVGHIKYPELDSTEILIIHDIIGKAFLDHFPKTVPPPIFVAFIHTLYRDTDYFGDMSDDDRRERTEVQRALVDAADIVFTSGGWIAEQMIEDRPALRRKIRSFVPGRLNIQPCGSAERGTITTFGRLSLTNDKKQASSILSAYKNLVADSTKNDQLEIVPNLRLLGVKCTVETQQEIKKEIFSTSGWAGRVEFLSFQNYYDFDISETKALISDSKIIITPSIVESFGLTSLEAISLGIPLIASRRSGFAFELKSLVGNVPETAIDWLDVSDFDDLASSLRSRLSHMLRRYESYRRGAMVLAEGIMANWPTWEFSCRTMCTEIAALRMAEAPKSFLSSESFPEAKNSFSALKHLLPPHAESISDETSATSFRSAPASDSEPARWSLEKLAKLAYGRNLTPKSAIADIIAKRYKDKTCTKLQQQVAEVLDVKNIHNYQDILLCGGTSSGKTTAAEILFGLANNSDFTSSRILYMAPTRALAQERWRDWSECFGNMSIPRCDENVIISTGEDHSNDRALARGDFLIACLVFEKANVILSTSPDLAKRLTMIVVDELHMIADIHRGPIIETLLAKLKYEKRRRQKRDDQQLPMRIVGITTEQSTAEGFSNYLTNLDWETDLLIPPLESSDSGRPTTVHHILVEPESDGQNPYHETPIATFLPTDPLHLNQEALDIFGARLIDHSQPEDIALYRGERGKRLKFSDKYVCFMKDWLHKHSNGRRLLVFIGSKADQVTLADRLQSEVKKSFSLGNRQFNLERLAAVLDHVKNDDTSVSIDIVGRALARGIFIHNADINRNLRFGMEDYLSQPLPAGAASEVVIATETLSYGVNLAIDDVALMSLEFPASERNQEYGASPKLLSRCAFANMCGRAGRLNQSGREASIYVWPITDHQSSPRRLVEIFYCDEQRVGSKIVHADDKEAHLRLRKRQQDLAGASALDASLTARVGDAGVQGNRAPQAPLLFTYPFVKTFLDGLRFTGGAPGLNGATRRNDASIEELEDEFTEHLLYSQENKNNSENIKRLRESVKMVIVESMAPNIELVKKSGRGYKITPLGSSIIDTGTEITTLEPLKTSLERLMSILRTKSSLAEIPVEVLLISIVVQNEAHRQVITGMPELRNDVARDDNRKAMLVWLKDSFTELGFTDEVVSGLGEFLIACDSDPRHAPAGETSTELVHDACLRLFCGLLLWVSGNSISDIHKKLSKLGRITGNAASINTNFAAFAERISWKVKFLVDLMRFTKGPSDVRMLQTKARRLITRLHFGCAENALPFLAKDGNKASAVSRRTAHELLRARASPKSISAGDFDLDSYSIVLASQIRTQVRHYIRSSFHHLKSEFIYSTGGHGADSISRGYWDFADIVIRRATENNPSMPDWPTDSPQDLFHSVVAAPGVTEADCPTVRLKEEGGVLLIVGHKLQWDDDTKVPVDAVKWQVQASHGTNLLRPAPDGYKNVIVDFPWLLRAVPSDTNVLRMSPAAFGILLTLITRTFFKDSVSVLESLSGNESAISSLTLIDKVYSELNFEQLPDPLFDAWAGYWDAE